MKTSGRKLLGQDLVSSAFDVQRVNNGSASENISWVDVLNSQGENYPDTSGIIRPVPAELAVDCENVAKAHLPPAASKVTDDTVELEMTVTSEFTLVGYRDEDDENVPEEEILNDYLDLSEALYIPSLGRIDRVKGTLEVSEVKQEKDLSRRRRSRRAPKDIVDDDMSDSESYKIVKLGIKKERLYKCEECDRSFPTAGGLKIHMMVHVESGNYTCFLCGTSFDSLRALKTHVASHSPTGRNVCDECGRWYKDQKVLKKHVARHMEADSAGKIIDCGMCGTVYETDADLAEHVLGHVSEMKWNVCLVCGRRLAPLSSMEKHLRTHTGEKMATCPVCARKFAEAYNLKSHMRIHTGERPYSCPQCKRRFTSVSTLKNHILTHSSEKHYACTYCDKRFRRSSHLVEHRRSHTGERPYACMHCGKRYTTSTALRSAMLRSI